jgi:glutathione peroxidase
MQKTTSIMKWILISLLVIISGSAVILAIPNKQNKNMTPKQRILKKLYPLVVGIGRFTGKNHSLAGNEKSITSIYDFKIVLNDGSELDLSNYKGKKIMIVNTASDCGYTGQYESLEALYRQKKDSLVIIGFPANDFGNQEKGDNATIAAFCKKNYGVSFPLAEKSIVVKKDGQHPLFMWLTDPAKNGWNKQAPTWNFCKYLIDENGNLLRFSDSNVEPSID